jgi:hypothetical protein
VVKTIFWHDGTLDALRLIGPTRRRMGSIEVDVSLYATAQSKARERFTLTCLKISIFEISGDMDELQDNAGAGNIEEGLVRKSGVEWEADLRLVRGRLRVRSKTMRLKRH